MAPTRVAVLLLLLSAPVSAFVGPAATFTRRASRDLQLSDAEPPLDLGGSGEGTRPTMEQGLTQLDMLMQDPRGMAILNKVQSDPKLVQAMMAIANEGDAAAERYRDDPEVMDMLKMLREVTLGSGSE
eukprot:CAMPEP_0206155790 /NCGR_PEP_ID=MMETSP1474-20131121/2389_1 /ASSEMBLY_ACC=CAM_ASM_001110 /TAXON_ID=97495 /ORGANISM="Imantonia sp., Strain RCC918" /LENGTH=127 /DNA_ID=CAMNT_0053554559 /DNA_START=21 /DNA_END=404 /DNA_ORIENTATION=-